MVIGVFLDDVIEPLSKSNFLLCKCLVTTIS
jgi:hypothetical protein